MPSYSLRSNANNCPFFIPYVSYFATWKLAKAALSIEQNSFSVVDSSGKKRRYKCRDEHCSWEITFYRKQKANFSCNTETIHIPVDNWYVTIFTPHSPKC